MKRTRWIRSVFIGIMPLSSTRILNWGLMLLVEGEEEICGDDDDDDCCFAVADVEF